MAADRAYLRARFTECEEFLSELAADTELVERGIVRVTKLARPTMNGAVTQVSVRAGAIVDGRPVELHAFVGDLWGHAKDREVQDAATLIVKRLEEGLAELGLDCRAGIFEEVS